jgi:hypothetical protein
MKFPQPGDERSTERLRFTFPRQRDERISADVVGDSKRFAGSAHEIAFERFLGSESD